ncbi:MAG: hypothetical protein KatS3mg101_0332 [Patescibacteria group bacterium]|nr:MAG: hypothetical protein KatS3mg101_0332 [Patescibacteria group bacterium]
MIYVINGLQDPTFLYVLSRTGIIYFGHHTMSCFPYSTVIEAFVGLSGSTQPLLSLILLVFLQLFGTYFFILWPLLVVLLNFLVSEFLFRNYRMSVFYSLILTFCSYFWIKLGLHMELIGLWTLAMFMALLGKDFLREDNNKRLLPHQSSVLFIVLTALISNYLSFIVLATYCLLILSWICLSVGRENFKYELFARSVLTILFSVAILCLVLIPFLSKVYLGHANGENKVEKFTRPYEDFITFSLRPWYFFIPSPKNPIYGEFSKTITSKIESTGYFLADDYFPAEHSAAFFGYLFLITFAGCLIYGYKKLDPETRKRVNVYLLTTILLVSFTMPPYFTISGLKIYTPGHLIAVLFPMFRVTARFSPMILLFMLMIMAEIINVIHIKHQKFFKIFMPILLVVTLVETFVPFKITKYDKVPRTLCLYGSARAHVYKVYGLSIFKIK